MLLLLENGVYTPGTVTDQTQKLRMFNIRRGRPFNLARVEASTADFLFKNGDGVLDPANPYSPYYPNVLPLKEMSFSRREDGVTYNRIRGPIERYVPLWQPPAYQEITVGSTDAFETLANRILVSGTGTLTTALAGSNNDLVFTARNPGGQGDDITVTYSVSGTDTPLAAATNDPLAGGAIIVAPAVPASFLSLLAFLGPALNLSPPAAASPVNPITLTVQGTDITVTVGTDGSGNPTSTAAQIKAALEASDAMALVSVALAPANDGSGVVTAMAATNLSGGKWAAETTGARINRCLDEAAWPADKREIDDGVFTVIAQGFSEAENVSALTHMQDVADSELGYVFVDGNGVVHFHDGNHRSTATRSTVSQATYSDDGTGFPYHAIEMPFDTDRIVNDISVSSGVSGAVPQTVEDSGSQAVYGVRTFSKSTLLANDADALTVAQTILDAYKDPHTRIDTISLYMPTDSSAWTPAVLGREIGDLVTVRTTPPVEPGETAYTVIYDCWVESIEDSATPGSPWQVTFQLTPVSEALG